MAEVVDPNTFIITRKRKKYRFALFSNSPLCFELEEWPGLHALLQDSSKANKPEVIVEVGAGTGLFSVELAALHPERVYVAVDVKGDRLQKGAREAEARELRNIWFVRARANQLLEVVEPGTVSTIWVTFPDPFPKKRSAARRLTCHTYLPTYTNMLIPGGSLCLKHDNLAFFTWALEQLISDGWHLRELSFDLHDSNLSEEYKLQTTYETKWLSEGGVINFVRATRS